MKNLKNIKLIIAYDGTNYFGWQRQKYKKNIQGTIENTIRKLTGEKEIILNGSGRTDAGVHAIGQVANFVTKSSIPIDKWPIILNHQLPRDIRIKYAKRVNIDFHARYCAKSKIYKYFVMNKLFGEGENTSAKYIFLRNYCYFFNQYLDIRKMRAVSNYLIGCHDFSALSCINQKKGEPAKNKLRKIKKISITNNKQLICFSFEADAFLYKMVRVIIGTLIDFSIHQREPEEMITILENKDSQRSGKVIPAHGLYLVKVQYK
jgi:tRNA pseudouridine38-40 synthase